MPGGGKDQQTEADTVLLIKSLQKMTASTYDAETTTRGEIEAKHWHYNQNDSYFQTRLLYLDKEIFDAKKRTKSVAALLQPIREEQEEEFIFSSSS